MADGPPMTAPAASLAPGIFDSSATAVQKMNAIQQRYAAERGKWLRPEGLAQYIDVALSDRFRHYQSDPWSAIGRLITDRVSDPGRWIWVGFGGTWYWNRYPGLMCNIKSYTYMPLLEEMGYMPRHKYAFGPELRAHADRVADRYKLRDKAVFRMQVKSMEWDDREKEWSVVMDQNRGNDQEIRMTVRARFVISASGVLNYPQIPRLECLDLFKGHIFHTSRWDYNYTGGTPKEPSLSNLKNKSVGIIGTGATAIQCIPHVAKWAKLLIVFQRTPASVNRRDNRPTDPE
ncbi:hypothetical protein LTR28_006829 [Elasticomyces elasticus]|nr:hypothetical protein LTR28_006829 [Elasticomyces elasticus]